MNEMDSGIGLSSIFDLKPDGMIKTGTIYLLKFVFILFTAGIALVLASFFAGFQMILDPQANFDIVHLLFSPEVLTLDFIVFLIVMLSNSFFDIIVIALSTNTPLFSAIRYNVIKNAALTKILVILLAAAGIGYLPLFRIFGYDYCIGMLVWMIHAGTVLFISRYTEILSFRRCMSDNADTDPFKIIHESMKIIKSSALESCTTALFEFAVSIGLFALVMDLGDIYAAALITSIVYLFIIKPISLKAAIRIANQSLGEAIPWKI